VDDRTDGNARGELGVGPPLDTQAVSRLKRRFDVDRLRATRFFGPVTLNVGLTIRRTCDRRRGLPRGAGDGDDSEKSERGKSLHALLALPPFQPFSPLEQESRAKLGLARTSYAWNEPGRLSERC